MICNGSDPTILKEHCASCDRHKFHKGWGESGPVVGLWARSGKRILLLDEFMPIEFLVICRALQIDGEEDGDAGAGVFFCRDRKRHCELS